MPPAPLSWYFQIFLLPQLVNPDNTKYESLFGLVSGGAVHIKAAISLFDFSDLTRLNFLCLYHASLHRTCREVS